MKAILLGGPVDGTLIQVRPDGTRNGYPPERITVPDPLQIKYVQQDPNDSDLMNTPIKLHQYEYISIRFGTVPYPIQTSMVFYFFVRSNDR